MVQRIAGSATLVIATLTALAWFVVNLLGWQPDAIYALSFIPARLSGLAIDWPSLPAWLTPLSATIVHANLFQLGFNLLMLVYCGLQVERVLGLAGLVVLYIVGAYAAALSQFVVDPNAMMPVVGASGAVSAVVGAFSLSFGRARPIVRDPRLNRWLNAAWLLAAWVVIQMMTGFIAGQQGVVLATAAAIGGFIAGLALQRPLLLWRYRAA